ncbi:MAG: segregation and condensation protein A, partial [Planctomycetota bacterium]
MTGKSRLPATDSDDGALAREAPSRIPPPSGDLAPEAAPSSASKGAPPDYSAESYSTHGYTVSLDQFKGPLDLLLYLVKRNEIVIEELNISSITESYLAFIEGVDALDVDSAGDYLVMAAQLLQIKARALLPDVIQEETDPQDPYTRTRLIEDLLEYRRLQGETRSLEEREDLSLRRFTRTSARSVEEIPLRHVDMWDLVTAFQTLQTQLGERQGEERVVEADAQPVHVYIQQLRARFDASDQGVVFEELFDLDGGRQVLVSTFLALLELIRLAEVRTEQAGPFESIRIRRTTAEEREALRP